MTDKDKERINNQFEVSNSYEELEAEVWQKDHEIEKLQKQIIRLKDILKPIAEFSITRTPLTAREVVFNCQRSLKEIEENPNYKVE